MSCICPWCEEHHPELDMSKEGLSLGLSVLATAAEQADRCRKRAKLLELRREIQNSGDT